MLENVSGLEKHWAPVLVAAHHRHFTHSTACVVLKINKYFSASSNIMQKEERAKSKVVYLSVLSFSHLIIDSFLRKC